MKPYTVYALAHGSSKTQTFFFCETQNVVLCLFSCLDPHYHQPIPCDCVVARRSSCLIVLLWFVLFCLVLCFVFCVLFCFLVCFLFCFVFCVLFFCFFVFCVLCFVFVLCYVLFCVLSCFLFCVLFFVLCFVFCFLFDFFCFVWFVCFVCLLVCLFARFVFWFGLFLCQHTSGAPFFPHSLSLGFMRLPERTKF